MFTCIVRERQIDDNQIRIKLLLIRYTGKFLKWEIPYKNNEIDKFKELDTSRIWLTERKRGRKTSNQRKKDKSGKMSSNIEGEILSTKQVK